MCDAGEIIGILDEHRLVEAETFAQGFQRCGARLIAEHHQCRITRHDAHQKKHQRQHAEQRRNGEQQTLGDE